MFWLRAILLHAGLLVNPPNTRQPSMVKGQLLPAKKHSVASCLLPSGGLIMNRGTGHGQARKETYGLDASSCFPALSVEAGGHEAIRLAPGEEIIRRMEGVAAVIVATNVSSLGVVVVPAADRKG
jgi:hypothetical protein